MEAGGRVLAIHSRFCSISTSTDFTERDFPQRDSYTQPQADCGGRAESATRTRPKS